MTSWNSLSSIVSFTKCLWQTCKTCKVSSFSKDLFSMRKRWQVCNRSADTFEPLWNCFRKDCVNFDKFAYSSNSTKSTKSIKSTKSCQSHHIYQIIYTSPQNIMSSPIILHDHKSQKNTKTRSHQANSGRNKQFLFQKGHWKYFVCFTVCFIVIYHTKLSYINFELYLLITDFDRYDLNLVYF